MLEKSSKNETSSSSNSSALRIAEVVNNFVAQFKDEDDYYDRKKISDFLSNSEKQSSSSSSSANIIDDATFVYISTMYESVALVLDSLKKNNPDIASFLINSLENESDHEKFLLNLRQIEAECFDEKKESILAVQLDMVATNLLFCYSDTPQYEGIIRNSLKIENNETLNYDIIEKNLSQAIESHKYKGVTDFLKQLDIEFAKQKPQLSFPLQFYHNPAEDLASVARIHDLMHHNSFIYKENKKLKETGTNGTDQKLKEEVGIITKAMFDEIAKGSLPRAKGSVIEDVAQQLSSQTIDVNRPTWQANLQSDNKAEVENSLSLDVARGSQTAAIFQSLDDATRVSRTDQKAMVHHIHTGLSLLYNFENLPYVRFDAPPENTHHNHTIMSIIGTDTNMRLPNDPENWYQYVKANLNMVKAKQFADRINSEATLDQQDIIN